MKANTMKMITNALELWDSIDNKTREVASIEAEHVLHDARYGKANKALARAVYDKWNELFY